jgi:hypothetical protein
MKCPKCQAKLMPVDGEMFCLQCGNVVPAKPRNSDLGPNIDETSDPLLQEAIVDAVNHPVTFKLPISDAAVSKPASSFSTMRTILAPQRSITSSGMTLLLPVIAVTNTTKNHRGLAKQPAAFNLKGTRSSVKNSTLLKEIPRVWWYAIAVFIAFVVLNLGIASYYANRVYPGVRVGPVALGGRTFDSLSGVLSGLKTTQGLTAHVGTESYLLNTEGLAAVEVADTVRQAEAFGRSMPLPIVGFIASLDSRPLIVQREINSQLLNTDANNLTVIVDRAATNAVPIIYDGQAFVIAEKSGSELDPSRVASEIRQNYGIASSFEMSPDLVSPKITTESYSSDLTVVQAMLELKLVVKFDGTSYSPTPQQIGSWLAFIGPGKGISVSSFGVAAYVNSLVGTFDKRAAAAALLAAVQARQPLTYTAITNPLTSASVAPVNTQSSTSSFKYCVLADSSTEGKILSGSASDALSDPRSWNLYGKLSFVIAQSNCNFAFWLATPDRLESVGTACGTQTTCQVGNTLAINVDDWMRAPVGWSDGLTAYRQELINHVVGQWLGFNHASCLAGPKTPMPILEAPTVVLDGCSPDWFQLPQGGAEEKILQGF